jgi:hypothetical protein
LILADSEGAKSQNQRMKACSKEFEEKTIIGKGDSGPRRKNEHLRNTIPGAIIVAEKPIRSVRGLQHIHS